MAVRGMLRVAGLSLAVVAAQAVLSGCAAVPDSAEEAALRERPEQPRMHADLIKSMLAQGQNYAALAHIEELERLDKSNPDQLRWLRALALYKLDQFEESRRSYQGLLNSAYAGEAHHGLGLIAARHSLKLAVRHFNQALKLRPTDPEIRNDLGYTLMMAGRLTEARHHLATATELDSNGVKAKSNLVVSFVLEGKMAEAGSLAQSFGIDSEQLRQLEAEGRVMRRLIARHADEFAAPAAGEDKQDEQTELDESKPGREPIPGLYSRQR